MHWAQESTGRPASCHLACRSRTGHCTRWLSYLKRGKGSIFSFACIPLSTERLGVWWFSVRQIESAGSSIQTYFLGVVWRRHGLCPGRDCGSLCPGGTWGKAGPVAAMPSRRCRSSGHHLLPGPALSSHTCLCWPLGTLCRKRRPGFRGLVLRGRPSPSHPPPRACSLQRFLPNGPVPAQEPLRLHSVGNNTEVALGERPGGLDLGRRIPPAKEVAEEAQPFLEAAGGTDGPVGPCPVDRPKGQEGHTRSA